MTRKVLFASFALMLAAGVALGAWYDDYDAGMAAVKKGQWQAVVAKMTDAIGAKPQENDKLRAYGTLFYNYHPHYYRGIAYMYLGQYDKAVADLEQATGPGEENLGTIETVMGRVKSKMAQGSTPPEPQPPAPQPPAPQPRIPTPAPQPAGPVISPAVRQQAAAAINEAKQAMTNATNRKANASPQFSQALTQLADANQKQAAAKSDDDLNAAIASANNAKMFFDSATGSTTVATNTAPVPVPQPRVTAATNATMGATAAQVRHALEAYFDGEFQQAAREFKDLSVALPNNGWIYAFLGASQYSIYAFEADDHYRDEAMRSFKKAKQLRFKKELPDKYFSKRIRKAFLEVAG